MVWHHIHEIIHYDWFTYCLQQRIVVSIITSWIVLYDPGTFNTETKQDHCTYVCSNATEEIEKVKKALVSTFSHLVIRELISKHDVDGSENVIWKLRFFNHFSSIQSRYAWKICPNYPEIKLEPALGTLEDKIEHLSSYARVVHTTAKQVISRRRKNENVFKMSKKDKCTCKACKNTIFHCQICKFAGFLLPSSSWLLKLSNTYN